MGLAHRLGIQRSSIRETLKGLLSDRLRAELKIKCIAFTVACVAIAYTGYDYYDEDVETFESARRSANVALLETAIGKMRYRVYGADNEPVVVLVHSFNGFIETWNPNIDSLVDQGFKVVAYDLWGRGYSDRPRIELSLAVFRTQLANLIDHVGASRVTLIGSSFGSVIVSDFAIQFPERVSSVVMLGPAGWPKPGFDSSVIADIPGVGDTLFHYRGVALTRSAVDAYFLDPAGHEWVVQQWDQFANYPGFSRSALSTLRHAPVRDYTSGWQALGQADTPVLVLWGKQDVSFPYDNAATMRTYVPNASVVGVEGAAHWVNIERSKQVNQLIAEFLVGR